MSAPQSDFGEVVLVPKTFPSPAHLDCIVELYKGVRLRGLQADPKSFSSTYEGESQFPYDTWLSRIQNPLGKTFVLVIELDSPSRTKLPSNRAIEVADGCDALQRLLRKEWVGIVTLLGPAQLPGCIGGEQSDAKPWDAYIKDGKYSIPATSLASGNSEGAHVVYCIVGMFVLPHARRKGHARRLIEATINAARDEALAYGAVKVSVTVQVEPGNANAQRLYEGVGFEVWDEAVMIANGHGATSLTVSLVKEIYLMNTL